MKQDPNPDIWRPVEELAVEWDAPVSEIMSLILDGDLEGHRCDYRWYVVRPVVTLHYPDPRDRSQAALHFRALRMGNYLTAGRSEVIIPIRHGDVGVKEALDLAWGIDESEPPMAATVRFGSQDWVVDSSLSRDLARCLLSFDVDFELQDQAGGEDTRG